MSLRFRRKPEPAPASARAWSLTEVLTKGTQMPTTTKQPHVMLSVDDIKDAPKPRFHCGRCGGEEAFTPAAVGAHRCVNPVTHQPLDMDAVRAVERRQADLGRKMLTLDVLPCPDCGATDLKPGVVHRCPGSKQPLAHDAAVAEWQRRGTLAALEDDLAELGYKLVREDDS